MSDMISRQAAFDALRDAENHAFNSYYKGLIKAHKIIADLPSAQPERKNGKWIRTRTVEHDGELYCDQCGQEHPEQKLIWNYCPNCGADMRGGQE